MHVQIALQLLQSKAVRRLLALAVVVGLLQLYVTVFAPMLLLSATMSAVKTSQAVAVPGGCVGGAYSYTGPQTQASDLSKPQTDLAFTIYQVATNRLGMGRQAAVIGIATAMQESTLGADPTSRVPNSDRDAGPFQQRVWWYGTLEQVNDSEYSATVFFRGHTVTQADLTAAAAAGVSAAGPVGYTIPGLAQVAGWERMSVTEAAQAVQRSAFPSAYAKHEAMARGLVTLFEGAATGDSSQAQAALTAGMCSQGDAQSCPVVRPELESGLTPDAVRVLRCATSRWPQVRDYALIGDRPANVDDDHQTGRGVDIMIPGWSSAEGAALGQDVASWYQANAAALGVKYVIWNAQIWSVERANEGWRACGSSQASCYAGLDNTAAHRDHVHVSVYGNRAGSAAGGAAPSSGGMVAPIAAGQYALGPGYGVPGRLWSSGYHTGQDFSADSGTAIRAAAAGTVVWVVWGGAYGNLTKVDHGNGVETWYAHQSSRSVTLGQAVAAGQVIGSVGATGNATGAHLHFEVRVGGRLSDPRSWLSGGGVQV